MPHEGCHGNEMGRAPGEVARGGAEPTTPVRRIQRRSPPPLSETAKQADEPTTHRERSLEGPKEAEKCSQSFE
jgi:hypothetical protein